MLSPNYRQKYLQLMKIAKENGNLDQMKRLYLLGLIREYRNEKAAAETATKINSYYKIS